MNSLDDEEFGETINGSDFISQRHFWHLSRFKSKKILLYVPVVFLLVVVVLAIIGYIFQSSPTNQVKTVKQTDSKCVHYTPQDILDKLPDDIDHLCHPLEIHAPLNGIYPGLTPCVNGSNKYIHTFCLCDSHINCVDTRSDNHKRTGCIKCSNKYHCPCQNGGMCNPCHNYVDMVSCTCSNGTIGSYCTKIKQRLCHVIKDQNTAEGVCDKSNDNSCFTREYSQLLKCEWSNNISSFLNDHPRCSNEIVEHMGTKTTDPLKDALGSAGKQDRSSNTSQTSSNNFHIGIIVLGVLSVISLLLYIYKSRNKHNR